MREWKFVGFCLFIGCLIFFSLNLFAKALQPDTVSLDGDLGDWKVEAMSATFDVIDATGPNSVWAMGQKSSNPARLYHYNGDKWQRTHTFDSNAMTLAFEMVSDTDGWASGRSKVDLGSNTSGGLLWRYDGTQWNRFFTPIEQPILAFDMHSSTEGWALGRLSLLKFDGNQWQDMGATTPLSSGVVDFMVFSDSQMWILSRWSQLYVYDGVQWQEMDTELEFTSLSMISPTEGWASGKNRGLFRYDGTQWSEISGFSDFRINDIDMLSPDNGWAIGYDTTQYNFNIALHYNGEDWQLVDYPQQTPKASRISMADGEHGWVIDENGEILEYMDGVWQAPEDNFEPTHVTRDSLRQVQVYEDGTVWFENLGRYFDGSHWQSIPIHPETQNFVQIFQPSQVVTPTKISLTNLSNSLTGEGWALGFVDYQSEQNAYNTLDDVLFQFDGGMWKPLTTTVGLSVGPRLSGSSFQMFSESDGWLLHDNGSFYRYESGKWEHTQDSTIWALDSYAISATDIWVIGGSYRMFSSDDVPFLFSAIVHFNGTIWQTIEDTPGKALHAIDMVSDTEGWAVGDAGTILHYVNGNWILEPSPITSDLQDIDMISATEGWAISQRDDNDQSAILYYDGNSWQIASSIQNAHLYAISILNRYTGYIAGDNGLVLKLFDQAAITPESGGKLVVSGLQDRKATIQVPQNTVDTTTTLVYKSLGQHPSPGAMVSLEPSFTLQAYRGDDMLETLNFAQPVTLTIDYGTHLASPKEQSIVLMSWDGQQWVSAASTCGTPTAPVHDMEANSLTVFVCRTGEFGLFMERGSSVYLPFVSDR